MATTKTLRSGPRAGHEDDGTSTIWSLGVFGNPLIGTASADILLAINAGTITGLGSDDLILGDISNFLISATGNNSFANAIDLDGDTNLWSIQENPLVADDAVPHMTVYVSGEAGTLEYFKIVVGVGQTLTIDIDCGGGTLGSLVSTDTVIALYAASDQVNAVVTDNVSEITDGGYGSVSTLDPFVVFTNNTGVAATYFIQIREFAADVGFEADDEFLLNVSLTGHAVGVTSPQNIDTIDGGTGNDHLFGAGGNDSLNGGTGVDLMVGGTGNDSFFVDDAGDVVAETAGEGSDQVYASVSYILTAGSSVEVLAAANAASTAALNLTGNSVAQQILGNAGANILTGGGGADALYGYGGDDVYFVEGDDYIAEAAGGGFDQAYSSTGISLSAGAAIEVLSVNDYNATNALTIIGNEFAQQIFGNAGANTLVSGGGQDALYGGLGNDIYLIDGDDFLSEGASGGFDQAYSSTGITLGAGAHIEVLSVNDYASTNALTIIGNELAQQIFGNAGANTLVSGGGLDALYGNGGDDIYLIDGDDHLVESAGGGFDQAYSSSSIVLTAGASIEILGAADSGSTASLNFTGNAFGQQVFGNAGANVLNGGGGNDALYGRGGADSFAFTASPGGGNFATLADFSAADDTILLDDAVFAGLSAGALNPNAFVVGTAAQDADDRIIYNSATGGLFYDADGSGSGAAVLFATLTGAPAITASDFIVI